MNASTADECSVESKQTINVKLVLQIPHHQYSDSTEMQKNLCSEVLTTVNVQITIFWEEKVCNPVDMYHCFGGICSSEMWYSPIRLHSFITLATI
jgi:hypothetical protein